MLNDSKSLMNDSGLVGLNVSMDDDAAPPLNSLATGNMMLLFPQNQHFHYVQKKILEGCGWYAVSWTFESYELMMVMVYFKCGDGIQIQQTLNYGPI